MFTVKTHKIILKKDNKLRKKDKKQVKKEKN